MTWLRTHLTYSNVVSTLCLFVLLGGVSYAAVKLPKNSVGTGQLKANAVTSSKVKNGSLLAADFRRGQIPAGAKGDTGPKGDTGAQGPPGPFADTLPSGKTVVGAFHIRMTTVAGETPGTGISYGFSLASAPATHYVKLGDPVPAECGGTAANPRAQPGNVCFYEVKAVNTGSVHCLFATDSASSSCDTSGKTGVGLQVSAGAPGDMAVWGTWAVTAP